ncbi:oligosaccharide flippase family protein [Clostridium intestinale]|uniref:Membrane protein involved in the export of O-antigen and teichoic acid n=1 Tax=Clostridium intestinale DSM 6191 TaxID=1121320 RepID=A0A1M6DKK7_9CLOT|nr:oligosaccharide flippase family protein [Clostridium intestinale]SHI73681.1 Membrane protein involved in the export of O-antigen and teichoic acid [Clostridium intestinale DSM 6191]
MSNLNKYIKKLMDKGLFHIFGANIINKIILFFNNAVIVRLVTIQEFSAYSYANNILSIVLLLNGLGVTSGLLQFCSSNIPKGNKASYEKYAYKIGVISNLIITLMILIISVIIKLPVDSSNGLLLLMSGMPVLSFILEYVMIKFRTNLQNDKFSYINTINTVLIFLSTIIGGLIGDIDTIIMLRYVSTIIPIIVAYLWLKKDINQITRAKVLLKSTKSEFMKFSITSLTNNALSQILYLFDIFLIGILITDNTSVGIYRTATLIPFTLNFIPLSIATFIYPYFVVNSNNKRWLIKNTKRLISIMALFNIIISLVLVIFAPLIIRLLFGQQYIEAVPSFRLLSIGYFIAGTFRIPVGNILTMLKKIKYLLFVTISTGIVNIVLDYILISRIGYNGAAVTVVIVYTLSSLMTFPYLVYNLKHGISKHINKKTTV